MVDVRIRRIFEAPAPDDGWRALVDRLWPRGISKAAAALDEWCTVVAPSTALRRWYDHDPTRWLEFDERYRAELQDAERRASLERLRERASSGTLTLLTATRTIDRSHAAVLQCVLDP